MKEIPIFSFYDVTFEVILRLLDRTDKKSRINQFYITDKSNHSNDPERV